MYNSAASNASASLGALGSTQQQRAPSYGGAGGTTTGASSSSYGGGGYSSTPASSSAYPTSGSTGGGGGASALQAALANMDAAASSSDNNRSSHHHSPHHHSGSSASPGHYNPPSSATASSGYNPNPSSATTAMPPSSSSIGSGSHHHHNNNTSTGSAYGHSSSSTGYNPPGSTTNTTSGGGYGGTTTGSHSYLSSNHHQPSSSSGGGGGTSGGGLYGGTSSSMLPSLPGPTSSASIPGQYRSSSSYGHHTAGENKGDGDSNNNTNKAANNDDRGDDKKQQADSTRPSVQQINSAAREITNDFIDFITACVTPFHCVAVTRNMLQRAGFTELAETREWPAVQANGKYFVTRNDSTIVAFAVGGRYQAGNGIKLVGAHTDSPNLMLKPKTAAKKGGHMQVGVQTYGGGLWHTWFDRDLTVAGRLLLQKQGQSRCTSALVNLRKPILRVSNLCIHLQNAKEREGFGPNKETHIVPCIATELAAKSQKELEAFNGQSATLMRLLAESAQCAVEDIVDFDLSVVDTQKPCLGGAFDEFIYSARIDNLVSCYCALNALCNSVGDSLPTDNMIRMIALFDNEEVGSASAQGAGGTLIPDVIERIHGNQQPASLAQGSGSGNNASTQRARCIANSFHLSVDGAHALHPNYADKHEAEHRPKLHEGPTIKYNANQRYGTTSRTAAVVKSLARLCDIPIQSVCVRNDSPCGSTIGPIISTLTGIQTVDLGNPMLSMHSVREMCGTNDVWHLSRLIKAFFDRYEEVRIE